jgi:hypothetical protein
MRMKYKITMEQVFVPAVAISLVVGTTYVLAIVLNVTIRQILTIPIATAVLAVPAYVVGNFIGFRKYYINKIHGLGISELEHKGIRHLTISGALIPVVAGLL